VLKALALARQELDMQLAMLTEVRDDAEVIRHLVGDPESFGFSEGEVVPFVDTYCAQLLAGHIPNVLPDVRANERVRGLRVTRSARIGAWIGVPLSAANARLYVLCCLAHESRPRLGPADLQFLRGIGATIAAEIEAHAQG